MTERDRTEFKIYRDGARYIIGPEHQPYNAYSLTVGYADVYSKREARAEVDKLSNMSPAELAARLRDYDTWDRFEDACEAGAYGPDW